MLFSFPARRLFFCWFALLTFCIARGQNETAKWYFPYYAGLDFMTEPPTVLTNGQMMGGEGCTTISDPAGNLLFYSEGSTIWNSAHAVMANGTGLWGNHVATQSSLIIKQPGNTNIYFIFTILHNNSAGLSCSTVDMSLAAGLGSVTVKNAVIYPGIIVEKLAATRHCNGTDVWVVCHETNTRNFRSYLVTATGVSTTAVVSTIGSPHVSQHGQMKISPTGKKLGLVLSYPFNTFELFDFNNATGALTNSLSITSASVPNFVPPSYGCEFSPDGSKFYASGQHLYQWDLCVGLNSFITASEYTVGPTGFSLQLAKNGKIYLCRDQDSTLAVINEPNKAGAACNYTHAGQWVKPKITGWGLPAFMGSYFKKPRGFETATISNNCNQVNFTIPCYGNNFPLSISWNFGDPSSSSNTSTQYTETHTYPSGGTYTVQLIRNYFCSSDTVSQVVTVPYSPTITVSGNTHVCAGQAATLIASGANTYTWNNSLFGPMAVVAPQTSGTYTVAGTSATNNCVSTTTVGVIVNALPSVTITGNKTLCESDSLFLSASGASTYVWNNGNATPTIKVKPLTNNSVVSVTGVDNNGCSGAASVVINAISNPVVSVQGPNDICAGESTTLTASGANTYTWAQHGTAAKIVVKPMSTSLYTVTGTSSAGNCMSTQIYLVNVSACIGLDEFFGPGQNPIEVYPNPNDGLFLINSEIETEVYLFNSYGLLLETIRCAPGENSVLIHNYPAGIYFLYGEKLERPVKLVKLEK